MSCLGNPRIDLSSWKMSAFSWFCTLCHFNLNLFCADKISACYAKSSGSDLLNCRTFFCIQTLDLLTAFTAVGFAMQTIHGDCKRLMCLLGNGSVGHSTCLESLNDFIHTLYFFNRNTFLRIIKIKLTSQINVGTFFIYHICVLLKHFIIAKSCRLLKHMDRTWIVQMFLATASGFVLTETVQRQIYFQSKWIKCLRMSCEIILCNLLNTDAANTADCICKISVNKFFF